jgi:hypothetical protein
MKVCKVRLKAAKKKSFAARLAAHTRQTIIIAVLCAVITGVTVEVAQSQISDFRRTGQIRAIVSEVETEVPPAHATAVSTHFGVKFSGAARAKIDFYFTYSSVESGKAVEKWAALTGDKDWSALSNRPARASGNLRGNKLFNAEISPVGEKLENYLTDPPPTVGTYKIVAVPLTIQPTAAAAGKISSADSSPDSAAASNVTPEAIRHLLFNAPNAVNRFYREASYGMFGFAGAHHPQADVVPVTITATISGNCQEQIINQFTQTVRQRLLEQNIDTTNGSIDLGIIIFNDTAGCPNYPFVTRGALGQRGVPQWLWMPESWFVSGGAAVMAHEIGHALGNNHVYALRCADFDNAQTCVFTEADDRGLMTYGGRFYMMPNNFERRRWGWHPPGAFDASAAGNLAQTFDLHSPVLPAFKDGARRGRFYFRGLTTGAHFEYDVYPEARRNQGMFEKYQAADESFRAGIAVRIGHKYFVEPGAVAVLLDPNGTPQVEDAPLRENQQVAIGGVTIKCLREQNPFWGTRMRVQ